MTGNALLAKEIVSTLRSRAAGVVAGCFVAALYLLAFAMWPESGVAAVGALNSRLFFCVILVAQLAMLALFSPPFSATAITHEQETNTWEMLYYSRLRPDQILVGKLAGATVYLFILVALSLPAAAVCFLLGGVAPREMFLAYLVLLAAGVTFGLLGLTWSSVMRSSFSSLIATYTSLLALCGGVYMPMLLLPGWVSGQGAMHAVRCLSPFTPLLSISRDEFAMMPGGSAGAVLRYFTYSGVLCAVMAAFLIMRIMARPRSQAVRSNKVIDETTPLSTRVMRRIIFVIDPRRRRASISDWINPIFVLDLRTRTAGVGNLARATAGCLVVALGLTLLVSGTWGATDVDTIRIIALSFQVGLVVLIAPTLTIGAVSSEVERRTFDHLRMAPLSPWVIFSGKLAAAAVPALLLVIVTVPVFLVLQVIQHVQETVILKAMFAEPEMLLALSAILGVTAVFSLSTGLFFSATCRTTARAGAWAYGVISLAVVGTLLGVVLRERLGESVARFVVAFNPIVTAVAVVSPGRLAGFDRWQNNVLALGSVSIVLILATVYRFWRLAGPED